MTRPNFGDSDELTADEVEAATQLAAGVPRDVRREFDRRVGTWKASWHTSGAMLSSDTRDYARGPEFEQLIELGPAIVPLVLHHIATEPDGFFILAALERLTPHADLVAATPDAPLESQQSRSRRAVRRLLPS
ncbi:MAG: hypothetical protein QOG34_2225 [Frankiaceae bacterium]|jgi:hypothetical protein|nr:hypothetical protein [Frankiaceae bacterium]